MSKEKTVVKIPRPISYTQDGVSSFGAETVEPNGNACDCAAVDSVVVGVGSAEGDGTVPDSIASILLMLV